VIGGVVMKAKQEFENMRIFFRIMKIIFRGIALFLFAVDMVGFYYLYRISGLTDKVMVDLSYGLANSCKSIVMPMLICAFLAEVAHYFQIKSETYLKNLKSDQGG